MRALSSHSPAGRCGLAKAVASGQTLLEAVLVLALLALILGLVALNLFGMIGRSVFDEDVGRFARTLRLTCEQAMRRRQQLAVVIDVTDGYYTVYEANSQDRYTDELEPLIEQQGLDECYIDSVELSDGGQQFSGELILHATPQGWQESWLFSFIDLNEQLRWLRCDRRTMRVMVDNQPLVLPEALREVSMTAPL